MSAEKPFKRVIHGAKGGASAPPPPRAPVEAPDSLRSTAVAEILDLICEGEIEGLVDGVKSIYLDDTPLYSADGTPNFSGISVDWRNGTQDQSYMPGFADIESEVAVAVEITAAAPVVRSVTNPDINRVRARVRVPQLTYANNSSGDVSGTDVTIAIDLQPFGGSYAEVRRDTISGKTTSPYDRSYDITLTGAAPWNIRLRRLTPDSTTQYLQNTTLWDGYTEIIDAKLRYPNSAVVGATVRAESFRQVPKRGYLIRGLRIRLPGNYSPTTRVYSGVWNGSSWQVAYSNNPAWCLYYLFYNDRFGLGKLISPEMLDAYKWDFYAAGQYCDELVPDGFGSMEPRFTLNCYIQTQQEAYQLIADMASVFRAMTYWGSGSVALAQDAPQDPVALYTPGNVIDGNFQYEGSSKRARHTAAVVWWNDPDDGYRRKPEYVEDADGVARYGLNVAEVTAFGCTSRGQAHRTGKWLLYSEINETDVVKFGTGLDSAFSRPGNVIKVADPARAGKRLGGRVIAAGINSITLDAAVIIEAGKTYTINLMLPDGTLAERGVTNGPGEATVLTFTPDLSAAPVMHSIWVLAVNDLQPQTFRVLHVSETDKAKFQIVALDHNPLKYAAVEFGLDLEQPQTVSPIDPRAIGTPRSFSASVTQKDVTVSWIVPAASLVERYRVETRPSVTKGNWTLVGYSDTPAITFAPVSGRYELRARAENFITQGPWGYYTFSFQNPNTNPLNLAAVSVNVTNNEVVLSWDRHPEERVYNGGVIEIRARYDDIGVVFYDVGDPVQKGLAWDLSTPSVPDSGAPLVLPAHDLWATCIQLDRVAGAAVGARFPAYQTNAGSGSGTAWIRVIDRFGNYSDVTAVDFNLDTSGWLVNPYINSHLAYTPSPAAPLLTFAGSDTEAEYPINFNVAPVSPEPFNGERKLIAGRILWEATSGDSNIDSAENIDSDENIDTPLPAITCEWQDGVGARKFGENVALLLKLIFRRTKLTDNFALRYVSVTVQQKPVVESLSENLSGGIGIAGPNSTSVITSNFYKGFSRAPSFTPFFVPPTDARTSGADKKDRIQFISLTRTQATWIVYFDPPFSSTPTGGYHRGYTAQGE